MICYSGRVDDQYGIGYAKPNPTTHDLETAIGQLLANQPVLVSKTSAPGCRISAPRQRSASGEVTFSRDIAPIINQHCVQCHREGDIGPMPLSNYSELAGWADMILEVIDEGRMPPWHANPKYGHFSNDRSLSETEKSLVRKWVEAGLQRVTWKNCPHLLNSPRAGNFHANPI